MQKKYNPEQTLKKIVSVSAKLFFEKGYSKTSMQDIVNELGMSKGAIFHHFKSKDDIFEAVIMRMALDQVDSYKDKLAKEMQHLTARDKITSLIILSLTENENAVSQMLQTRIFDSKVIVGIMKFNVELSAPIVADLLREGIEDGSINTKYPDECAQVLMLLFNIWCDPIIFKCDMQAYRKRFEYLQHLMKISGVDIITDELIELNIRFTQKLSEVHYDI